MRVSKILAQAGLASRRGAEALLEAGRVTINGVVRREPGAQADPATDLITLDGRAVAVKVQYPGIAETIAGDEIGRASCRERVYLCV